MEPEHIKERMTRIDSEGWTGTGKTREYIEREQLTGEDKEK